MGAIHRVLALRPGLEELRLQRYGIDAAVHELNCNWVEGLKDYSSAAHWMTYGENLADVFHDYFVRVKP